MELQLKDMSLIKNIIANTNHTVDSLAEILDLDNEEMNLLLNLDNKKNAHYKLKVLSDFLTGYNLVFE